MLDAGTNEVEIIELLVGGQSFGINVAKIREIIQFDAEAVHKPSHAHPSVAGVLCYLEGGHLLIDLGQHLYGAACEEEVVVVTEFNGIVAAFLVDGVNRIYDGLCSLADRFLSSVALAATCSMGRQRRSPRRSSQDMTRPSSRGILMW